MHVILYKIATFHALNQSRSILLVPPKYINIPLQIKRFGHVIIQSCDLGGIIFGLLETINDILGLGKVSFR